MLGPQVVEYMRIIIIIIIIIIISIVLIILSGNCRNRESMRGVTVQVVGML